MKLQLKIILIIFPLLFLLNNRLAAQDIIDGWLVYNTGNSSIPGDHIRSIKFDSKRVMWVGTWDGGIGKYKDYRWTNYNRYNSDFPSMSVNEIAIDKNDQVWVATQGGGFAHFDGIKWTVIELPGDNTASSIAITKKGVKIIGTPKDGLYTYDTGGHLTRLWGNENNPDKTIHHVTVNNQGNALVSTNIGLLKFTKTARGGLSTGFKVLRKAHTLRAITDKKGSIWASDFKTRKLFRFKGGKWKKIDDMASKIYVSLNDEDHDYHLNTFTVFHSNRVVIGTQYFGGLAHYTNQLDYWSPIFPPYSGYDFTGSVQALAEGENQSIWVGTLRNGLMIPIDDDDDDEEDETPKSLNEVTKKQKKEAKTLLKQRRIQIKDTIYTKTKEIEILIWDSQKPDGDKISLIFNDEFLLKEHVVTKTVRRVTLTLEADKPNKLVMYAHNMGDIPPNTASISVIHKDEHKETQLTSDLMNAQALILIHDLFKTMDKRSKIPKFTEEEEEEH